MRLLRLKPGCLAVVAAFVAGCGGTDNSTTLPTESSGGGGASIGGALAGGSTPTAGGSALGGANVGGVQTVGGASSTIGTRPTGGTSSAVGGAPSTGGRATGGAMAIGGSATGGAFASGGASSSGGANLTGGASSSGGAGETGGAIGTGGMRSTGGTVATGGQTSKGGNSATGGSPQTGGTTGTTGSPCGATSMTYDVSNAATTCPAAVPGGVTSSFCNCVNEGPSYAVGSGFIVANNVWGSGAGPECVWATKTTLWGFASNHPNTGGVKSYPNIGYSPRQLLSSINTYTSRFDISVPGNVGVWEAAYDLWLRIPGGGNTRIEIMIWMYTYKAGPISSIVALTKPTIGDYTWTVHYGSNGSNATISFVNTSPTTGATANVTSGTVDIKAMLDWLIANNNTQYGKFDRTWTLDQVQWGWEISSDGGATQEFINNCFSVSSS